METKTARQRTNLPVITAIILLSVLFPSCREEAPPEPATKPAETPIDDDYVAALASANKFCEAWRLSDYPSAKMWMSRRLIRQHPEQRLRDAIGGVANPRHKAFKIYGGEWLDDGRIEFTIRLFLRYTGRLDNRIEAVSERIVLARQEKGNWLVDEFPIP